MLCCALLVLVLSYVRKAWLFVTGSEGVEAGFAPPATRAAPGAAQIEPPPQREPVRRDQVPVAALLAGVALGCASYAVGIAALLNTGVAESLDAGLWPTRNAVVVLFTLAATAGALRASGAAHNFDRAAAACVTCGIGASWWLLGLVDMHAFGLFEIADGALGWDALFHGLGLVLIAAGAWAYAPRTRTRPLSAAPVRS